MVKIIKKICDIKDCKNEADDMTLPYVRLFETTEGRYRYRHPSLGVDDYHICDEHSEVFEYDKDAVIYTYGAQGYDEHTIRRLVLVEPDELVEPTEDCEPDEPVDFSEYSLEEFHEYLVGKYPEYLYLSNGVRFKHNDHMLIDYDADVAYRTMKDLMGDSFIAKHTNKRGVYQIGAERYSEFDKHVGQAIKILEDRTNET